MLRLHQPATLQPSPVGFEVTMAPGSSAALDALVSCTTDSASAACRRVALSASTTASSAAGTIASSAHHAHGGPDVSKHNSISFLMSLLCCAYAMCVDT